jgi:hypothetical protein
MFSIGKYGGFYIHWKYTKRLCLGWVAVTFIPIDIDEIMVEYEYKKKELE